MSTIQIAETPAEISACYAVMAQLRPQYAQEEFMERVQRQMKDGYRLAKLSADGAVQAVAGFRLLENLAWSRFVYVDDLVTNQNSRSQGHGKTLLAWLTEHARHQGCAQLHLDSAAHRKDAQRCASFLLTRRDGEHWISFRDKALSIPSPRLRGEG